MKKFFFLLFMSLVTLTHTQENLTFTIEPDGAGTLIKGFNSKNECIGHAALDARYHPTGSIDELVVYPKYRNKRFSSPLLKKSIQFFQDKHFSEIHLEATPFTLKLEGTSFPPGLTEKKLIEFYKNHGFKKINDFEMIKRLPCPNRLFNHFIKKRPYISAVVAAPALSVVRYKSNFIRNQF